MHIPRAKVENRRAKRAPDTLIKKSSSVVQDWSGEVKVCIYVSTYT